jgi:excisionase family DNA binding protein
MTAPNGLETDMTHRTTQPAGRPATLSITEAAAVLGIGRTLAYELARTGELPTLRLGRRLVVPRHALERMLGASAPTETRS